MTEPNEHTNGSTPAGPQDEVYDPDNPIWINSCNGLKNEHSQSCDGNCERRPVTELEVAIFNEYNAWERASMNPAQINIDGVDVNIKVRTLSRILEKELGITESMQDIYYQEFKLEYLREIREQNEERVKQQRLQRMVPKRRPLLGPGGRPFPESGLDI